jgi:fucose permease
MPLLTGLVLPSKQKIILVATFALGGFVTVVDVVRIAYLQQSSTARLETLKNSEQSSAQTNIFWYTAFTFMWSSVEVNVGIICACIPVLKPLFVRITPKLLGSPGSRAAGNMPSVGHMAYSGSNPTAQRLNPASQHLSNSLRPLTSQNSSIYHGEEHNIELQLMKPPASQPAHGFYLPTTEVQVRSRISEQVPTPHIGPTQHQKSLVDLTDRESVSPLLIVTVLFFLWGFAYGLLGALNTKFQALVNITKGQTVAIHCVYFAAYFTAPPAFSYYVLTRFGFKITIIVGLCIFAVGSLVFWPSAILGSFAGFVVSNFIAALGLSTLEISANPFIALCGPPQRAEGRVNLAQAVRGVGTVTAVLLANLALFQQTSISSLVDAQWTYLAISIFSIALACLFYYYPLPEVTVDELDKSWGPMEPLPRQRVLGLSISVTTSVMVVAAISQCVSLGAQETVSPVTYPVLLHWLEHASSNQASLLLAALDGLVVLGRVIAGVIFLITPVRPEQLLCVTTVGASVTCLLSTFLNKKSVLGPVFLNYFFQSAIFPTIFVTALRGQGHRIRLSSAFQISSMVGGAIFPAVQYGVEKITFVQRLLGLPAALFCLTLILPLYTFWEPVRKVVKRPWAEPPRTENMPAKYNEQKATGYPEIMVEHTFVIEDGPA